jgi:hypothetical protein
MTTIADAFEGVITRPVSPAPALAGTRAVEPRVTEVPDDQTGTAGPSWLTRTRAAVTDDVRGAWLWDAHGPSIRDLLQHRAPAIERVPGENKALHAAWTAYNHAVLVLLIPLMFVFWAASHPARLLYALPIAAPITALWLI